MCGKCTLKDVLGVTAPEKDKAALLYLLLFCKSEITSRFKKQFIKIQISIVFTIDKKLV